MSSLFESKRKPFATVHVGVTHGLHVFNPDRDTILHHNKFYLVLLQSLTMCLPNALVNSIVRPVNPAELKAFEPPLKITLILLEIPVEISEQYGSK